MFSFSSKNSDREIPKASQIICNVSIVGQVPLANIFDKVDRIYGEPGAQYDFSALQPDGGGGLGGGGGATPPLGGGGFGDDLGDLGSPGSEDINDLGGEEGTSDLGDVAGGETTQDNLMESIKKRGGKMFVNERLNEMVDSYIKKLVEAEDGGTIKPGGLSDNFITNEGFRTTINELEKFSKNRTELDDLLD